MPLNLGVLASSPTLGHDHDSSFVLVEHESDLVELESDLYKLQKRVSQNQLK